MSVPTTLRKMLVCLTLLLGGLCGLPVASAHGGAAYFPGVEQWYALIPLVLGILVIAGAVTVRRRRPSVHVSHVLAVVFSGLVVAVIGAVALVQLSPITSFSTASRPFTTETLTLVRLALGGTVLVASVTLGRWRWPTKPRYAGLGLLLGGWFLYPILLRDFQPGFNPVGYLLFATLVFSVGYVAWRDCRHAIRLLYADSVTRRFGSAVSVLTAVFFMFSAGILIVLPDPSGVGISWTQSFVHGLPVKDPLVYWPAIEFWFPQLPLGGYLSVGMLTLVVIISLLVGLNGAIVAYQWRCQSSVGFDGAAGAAAIAAPNACCCCGPVLSQLAVVALGPSAAMPFYWLFIDVASPLGVLFFTGSIVLLLGNLVRFSAALSHRTP
ncbi:hypothetical protein EFA46_014195 (plasmid) [Halarchaeum sp. CBA1220]|uniref:hypothetical protein n=1 Tax=Halarchaeum sp. CBA1220 TaxID=1853682 RepID=UPI000F3A96F2|nr:hypothetical protein [Halarchaeum sp. CBA1220]QLC35400.1 hypothetical protein EFA46_014195 [Halarchaeum sp. CBA1220]